MSMPSTVAPGRPDTHLTIAVCTVTTKASTLATQGRSEGTNAATNMAAVR